ncbi:hypothetical protein [Streptomyces tauricus]|uniref:hypothetical protein n=1 Tax=Streptomyces tauricus TaxID=68274 RepID=UPI00341C1C87
MRIPLWSDLRLSVWEQQNPAAVQVAMPNTVMRPPIHRVLSMRGWMLLLVRYDWRKSGRYYQPEAPRSTDDGPGQRLRAAEFTARHWHQAALNRDDLYGITGAHAIACIRAALRGETRPEQLGLDEDVYDAFRAALGKPGPAATEAAGPFERVRALHIRNANTGDCEHCSEHDYPDYSVPFPCPTIKALDGKEQPDA